MIIAKNCSQSCLYFQGFWGSKLNGCLVVSLSNLYLEGIQQFSGLKIDVYIPMVLKFAFLGFWYIYIYIYIVGVAAILCLLERKNSTFL